jgi:hypothetical protein
MTSEIHDTPNPADTRAPFVPLLADVSEHDLTDRLDALGAEPKVQADGSIRCSTHFIDGGRNTTTLHLKRKGRGWDLIDWSDSDADKSQIAALIESGVELPRNGAGPVPKVEPAPLPPLRRRLELLDGVRHADELEHVAADLRAMGWRGHEDRLIAAPLHVGHTGDRFVLPVRDASELGMAHLTVSRCLQRRNLSRRANQPRPQPVRRRASQTRSCTASELRPVAGRRPILSPDARRPRWPGRTDRLNPHRTSRADDDDL